MYKAKLLVRRLRNHPVRRIKLVIRYYSFLSFGGIFPCFILFVLRFTFYTAISIYLAIADNPLAVTLPLSRALEYRLTAPLIACGL